MSYPTGGSSAIAIATGDFNGDGGPDLAVANNGSNNVGVLLNKMMKAGEIMRPPGGCYLTTDKQRSLRLNRYLHRADH